METPTAEITTSEEFFNSLFKGEETQEPTVTQTTEPVQPTPPVQEIVQEQEPPKQEESVIITTDYSKRLKALIQDELIENFAINYGDKQVYLDEIEDLTEDGYKQIIEGWKSEKDKEIKEKYLSVDGLDETTKKLIEIKKAGGDITEVIRENVTAIQNLQMLKDNMHDDRVWVHIVGENLKDKGISLPTIQAEIKTLIEAGKLEERATELLDLQLNFQASEIEKVRQAELNRLNQEKEDLKNLRKNLTSFYKDNKIPENLYKVFVDNSTKLDADKISNTDKLYFEAQKDPERFAEITMFLNNREEFKKWITSKETLKAKLSVITPAFTVNTNNVRKPVITNSSADDIISNVFKQ